MRVTSRVSRLKRVGVGVLLLAGGCVLEGCAANKMTRLDDAPIRVKNQKLEAELLTADPTDVWDLAGTDFTPKNSTHPHATIMVYVSKYSGALCPGIQPYKARSVTLEYGPANGAPTKTVKIRVSARKFRVLFPGANGSGTKVLEFAGAQSDYLRSIEIHYTGPPIRCTASSPSENMVVTLH